MEGSLDGLVEGSVAGLLEGLVKVRVGGHLTCDVTRIELAKARQNTCTSQPCQPPLSHSPAMMPQTPEPKQKSADMLHNRSMSQ